MEALNSRTFWTIPFLTIYIYAITVLAQFGFNSYFDIPYNFVEVSISVNTVYTYSLAHLLWAEILRFLMSWWPWLIGGLGLIFALIRFGSGHIEIATPSRPFSRLLFVLALLFLWGSVGFGESLAKTQTSYYVLPPGCITNANENLTYIVPNFYNGKALVIPIDTDKKIAGGFFTKDVSDTLCQLEMKPFVGPIVQRDPGYSSL